MDNIIKVLQADKNLKGFLKKIKIATLEKYLVAKFIHFKFLKHYNQDVDSTAGYNVDLAKKVCISILKKIYESQNQAYTEAQFHKGIEAASIPPNGVGMHNARGVSPTDYILSNINEDKEILKMLSTADSQKMLYVIYRVTHLAAWEDKEIALIVYFLGTSIMQDSGDASARMQMIQEAKANEKAMADLEGKDRK